MNIITGEQPCLTNETANPPTCESAIQLTSTSLDGLQVAVSLVAVNSPVEQVMDLREKLAFMAGQIKALQQSMDARLMEWIEANGAITIGTRKIYVGTKKDTKCKDLKPALVALLEASGGDWEAFAECLSSNAIKYGAAKTVLGEDVWAQHFEVVTKTELKEGEEKPVKQLVDFDEKFLPKKTKRTT